MHLQHDSTGSTSTASTLAPSAPTAPTEALPLAFGDNKSMGGSVGVASHLDGLVKQPTVWFDDRKVMDGGRLIGVDL